MGEIKQFDETVLIEVCSRNGFSYKGNPVQLVIDLFEVLRAKDTEINNANALRLQWLAELQQALKASPLDRSDSEDPVKHVRRLGEELAGLRKKQCQENLDKAGQSHLPEKFQLNLEEMRITELVVLMHACVTAMHERALRSEL